MRVICLTIMMVVFCISTLSVEAKTPAAPENLRYSGAFPKGIFTGIPFPGGQVPAAIMPTLPTAENLIDAFPYDPINIATPVWDGGSNQYYVDSNNNVATCTDIDNDQGSPATPRCTLPGIARRVWTLAANAQVFIVGNGAVYSNGAQLEDLRFTGTPDEPVWIIGVGEESTPRWTNQPKLAFEKLLTDGSSQFTHVFFHNVHFKNPKVVVSFSTNNSIAESVVNYVTVRHSTCSEREDMSADGLVASKSARCFKMVGKEANPVKYILLYDNDIFGRGHWQGDVLTGVDRHGVQPIGAVYYMWYLNNRSFHLQGDSIQCSNSNKFDFDYANRPHYIYVGGNEFYENYENAFDSKGCYHVIFSENYVHDFFNESKKSNNTALITPNDNESFIGGRFEWYLNNRIENVGTAFGYKGTAEDAFVYILGNFGIKMTGKLLGIEARCKQRDDVITCGDGFLFAQNTFDCGHQAVVSKASRNGGPSDDASKALIIGGPEDANQDMTFYGNMFVGCLDSNESPHGFEKINRNWNLSYQYNVDYRSEGGIVLSRYFTDGEGDLEVGNVTNIDPQLSNPNNEASGDYTILSGSPALRIVPVESPVYSLFESMYGIDIRNDITGKSWRSSNILNPGAFQ